ncbi:MAG TPA: class I SAM-dependent methyltransferase [Methanothrix sp.]|nr:class I SAM-dependent methyltransferase [Methanothrix sp.]HPC89164.1 class I SAM-dependent methyltransferase [Methanothrix sp.]HQE87891.1 class I SAM-dependent methyltransferase [Methanothrix sp.]HQI67547.1 class I SAM-dependent methyltransferase [Methanothrix sp.]HRS84448.1 class I SAM-dependent methyltransferase [Methanothrix sp.]
MISPLKDIDWNEVWKAQMLLSLESSPGRDCARIWESRERALAFWNMCKNERSRIDQTVWETEVPSATGVLDAGAGQGTLAIPFAQKAAHVTAVEPAEGMRSVMREKMAEHSVSNIDIVPKRWEDVDVERDLSGPYDVVIASFSLGMQDIRAAIEKMVQASSRYVYLYHFAGPSSWDRQWQSLWPKLHGRPYRPGPKSDVLHNVLYQMGVYPNVSVFRLEHSRPYGSLDEAVADLAPQARAESEEQKAVLREYLRRALLEDGGILVMPGSSVRENMWWEKEAVK